MLSATADYFAAPVYVPDVEDDDDFEIIVDEPLLCVVRMNDRTVAQVHSPVDLTELSYRFAEIGFVATEMLAYEDGVLEMLLRDLGDIPVDVPEKEAKLLTQVASYMKEREDVYAA